MVQLNKNNLSISIDETCLLRTSATDFRIHYHSDEMEEIKDLAKIESEYLQGKLMVSAETDSILYLVCELNFNDPLIELKDICLRFNVFPENPELWSTARNDFHWIPNIKSKPEHMAADAVFRSPVVMILADSCGVAIIPDLALIQQNRPAPYYLDMRFLANEAPQIEYGLAHYVTDPHQYYLKTGEPFLPCNSQIRFGCHIIVERSTSKNKLLRKVSNFLWTTYGVSYLAKPAPQTVPFETYARYGYDMALKELWVAGPIPNTGGITLSTCYDQATKKCRGRSFPYDLWFHSWFNNLRTAYGLYLWGDRLSLPEWKQKAVQVANLIVASPGKEGLFNTIYKSHDRSWQSSGQGGGAHVFHLPDNAWTAFWLLRFIQDCESIKNADTMLLDFAETLVELQHNDGSFPARVFVEDLKADSVLDGSASEALPLWFLAEMRLHHKFPQNLQSSVDKAIKAGLDHLRRDILPKQKFEDFELYFSCSGKPLDFYDSFSEMYGQNTLSIQWCAEAFRTGYLLFNRAQDLADALFCVDLLSLYQQVWNPTYLSFHAYGGFGVMNTDAEWNDARQAQFSETLANFYQLTGNIEYLQRAVAACRAAFTLMVIDENKSVAPRNYKGTARHFEIHGAMAENYGHDGYNARSYQSGFHWGTGSALGTAAILLDRFGDLYIDPVLKHSLGINGIVIKNIDYNPDEITLLIDALSTEQQYYGKINSSEDYRIKEIRINDKVFHVENNRYEFTWL